MTIENYKDRLASQFLMTFPKETDRLVFGEGPLLPKLMLIGEAPGEQEENQKRPFVGKAGRNLDAFLEIVGLRREEIYISNTVKIRPTQPGKGQRVRNRKPNKTELAFFVPWLLEELNLVKPQVVATLGNTPLQALLGKEMTVGDCHGSLLRDTPFSIPLFAMYHPASLIYNPSLRNCYEADIRKLSQLLIENEQEVVR